MLEHQAERQLQVTANADAALTPVQRRAASEELFSGDVARGRPRTSGAFYLRSALRHPWTIVAAFLAVALPGVAAVWLWAAPLYRARATVEISPTNPRVLYKTEDNGLIPMYQQYLNSQVGIIAGNTVLQRVIERKDVRETTWYRDPPWKPLRTVRSSLQRLGDGLKVRPRGRTFLIDIDFLARVPGDARVIVDAVLEEYKTEARGRVEGTDMMVLGTLAKTLQELRLAISGHEEIAEELRSELGTNTPEELISHKRLRLEELEGQLEEVERELQLAEWKWRQRANVGTDGEAQGEGGIDESPQDVDEEAVVRRMYEKDSEWWRLHVALEAARLRLDLEGQRLGQAHPTIVKLQEEAQRTERMLQAREAQLRQMAELAPEPERTDQNLPNELMLATRIEALRTEKELLDRDLGEQRRRFERAFGKATQLAVENEELHKQKSKAELVRRRLDEKETERGPVALIREVSRPLTPSRPDRDRRPILTIVVMLLGLGSGLALAFLRSSRSQTIHEADQLAVSCRAPFLGLLPLAEPKGAGHSESAELEHYRILRTALLNRLDSRSGRVALITSGGPGVGKTTVAVMLAQSLARCGKRVLLVDADVRAPGVAERLKIPADPGLLEVLKGQADDTRAIVSVDVPGLSVLPAGQSQSSVDAELLANGVFAACLKRWRDQYDVVLLDSPPVLPVADARILAQYADGTILVVREGYCRQPDVLSTLASLGVSGGKLCGTVYIGGQRSARYYNYAYRTYES